MTGKICLTFFVAVILVAGLRQWGGLHGPIVDAALQALLAGAGLMYLPLWVQSIRSGEITLPPRMLRRWREPMLFWIVATIHLVMALVIAGAMLAKLFGLL
jgi:hypothetical protein